MGMHKSKEISEADLAQLSMMMEEVSASADFRRLQSVYLRGQDLSVEEISKIVLYSISHIKRIWTAYFKGGIEALAVKPKGGRYRCNLSVGRQGN